MKDSKGLRLLSGCSRHNNVVGTRIETKEDYNLRLNKYVEDIDAAYKTATSYDELFSMLDMAACNIEPLDCFWLYIRKRIGFYSYDNGVDIVGFEMPV